MNARTRHPLLVSLVAVGLGVLLLGQERQPRVPEIRATPVAANVYMLSGAGGNVALLAGDEGAVLVDADFAALNEKLTAAVETFCKTPIRLVINTHWHFDHVEGNEKLAAQGAVIVAQENVRTRMSTEQVIGHIGRRVPPSPAGALPAITYAESLTLFRNGEEVHIIHVDPAHTDGDSLVYFCRANVMHMGDVYFAEGYPFIDVRAGGSLDGMIKAVDYALKLVNDKTMIIPGHGPLSSVADLRAYREMLTTARDRVRALVDQGKSRDEAIAAKPTRELDGKWGSKAFDPDMWVGIVYDGMVKK